MIFLRKSQTKTLFLETPSIAHFCPICGYRMHSRGVKSRKIKHPKYLISDTYNQYIDYVDKYFPNAVPVVDSFHVIQWIINWIEIERKYKYIQELKKILSDHEIPYPEEYKIEQLQKGSGITSAPHKFPSRLTLINFGKPSKSLITQKICGFFTTKMA